MTDLKTSTQSFSPLAKKVVNTGMDFYEAMKEVGEGNKIFRQEWDSKEYYGLIKDGVLMLHKPDGKFYHWIISDGDMSGKDWVVII